jgi:hypothetical protein
MESHNRGGQVQGDDKRENSKQRMWDVQSDKH